jgi:hypothetical protein
LRIKGEALQVDKDARHGVLLRNLIPL